MKISDVLAAATGESERFQFWLAFICDWEATLDKDGNIIAENDNDGEGITFCGLTQKSDNLPVDSNGNVTATPQWIVARFNAGYWCLVMAPSLSYPVGEVTANFGVNDGVGEAAVLLQRALASLGVAVAVDGQIGPKTLSAVWSLPDDKALARAVCAEAITHYHNIVAANPSRSGDLDGWINRTDDLLSTFCR